MAEYIEKEQAINVVDKILQNNKFLLLGERMNLNIIKDNIYSIPATDVQPVKRGHWVYYKNRGIWDIHKCTVCDTPFELPMDVVPSSVFCYCPHCGADMRGEDNG